jgi:two-component system response regulator
MRTEILYVEDNPADVFLLGEAIRKQSDGVLLSSVDDGESALSFLHGAKLLPCAIVLDIGLPRIDGTEVLKVLKSNPSFRSVPTAVFADQSAQRQMKKDGHLPELFLTKPSDLDGYDTVAGQILALCDSTNYAKAAERSD